jgi:signal transduction histidine kinase
VNNFYARPVNLFALVVLAGAPFLGLIDNRTVAGGYVLLHCIACILLCGQILLVPKFHDYGARYLALAVGFWGVGDIFWVWNYYFNAHSSRSIVAIITTETFYPACFALMIVGLSRRLLPISGSPPWRIIGGITMLLVPFVCKLLVIPLVNEVSARGVGSTFVLFESAAIVSSIIALVCACATAVVSTDRKWSLVSAGVITLLLADWGVRSAKILGVAPVFTYSTFLILLGCYVIGIALASPVETPNENLDLRLRHLTSWMKVGGIYLLLSPLAFLGVVSDVSAETVAKATFCAAAGAVFVVTLVHYTVATWRRKMLIAFPPVASRKSYSADLELEGIPEEFATVLAGLSGNGATALRDWKQFAHDLRAPLAALSVATQLFPQRPESAAALAKRAAERIGEMAMALERDGLANTEAPPVFCVPSVVREVVDEQRLRLGEEAGAIQLTNSASPWTCNGSAVEFRRLVSNLLDNGVRAVRAVSGVVNVTVDCKGSRCEICIRDTGIGMSEAALRQIRLYGRPTKFQGMGLGLLHAHRTIALMGGEIVFESSGENQGTLVRIRLSGTDSPPPLLEDVEQAPART